MHWNELPQPVLSTLRRGAVIPAHPLALGLHSTQFAIREVGLYRPVLELAIETAREWTDRPLVMIAGAVGKTAQAVEEARTARSLGYHAVLLSLAALKGAS